MTATTTTMSFLNVDADKHRRGLLLLLDGCLKHTCIKVVEVDQAIVGMLSDTG